LNFLFNLTNLFNLNNLKFKSNFKFIKFNLNLNFNFQNFYLKQTLFSNYNSIYYYYLTDLYNFNNTLNLLATKKLNLNKKKNEFYFNINN
jgi:hypothetical protein